MHLMFAMIFKNLRKNLDIKYDPLTFCEFNTVIKFVIASKVNYCFLFLRKNKKNYISFMILKKMLGK